MHALQLQAGRYKAGAPHSSSVSWKTPSPICTNTRANLLVRHQGQQKAVSNPCRSRSPRADVLSSGALQRPRVACTASQHTYVEDTQLQRQWMGACARPTTVRSWEARHVAHSSLDGGVGGPWAAGGSNSGDGCCSECPVYVALPLDTVGLVEREGQEVPTLKRVQAMGLALHMLKQAGVEGVKVDVWWGLVEHAGPAKTAAGYDFNAYVQLFSMCAAAGLKVHAVMAFHAAGGNVGDTFWISLPEWVLDIGRQNPDIFYTDKQMYRNMGCLSLGCDELPLFWGRTPVDMYRDFMEAFVNKFRLLLGSVITDITVGLGPAGELRYPSYPEGDGRWRFPGIGEYQCFDKYMQEDLRAAATAAGHPEWGHGAPPDMGHYSSMAWDTAFFKNQGGAWQSAYGQFFQAWYSGLLVRHARRVLGVAADVLYKPGQPPFLQTVMEMRGLPMSDGVRLGATLALVHWWFKSSSHAAELTAGYNNTRFRDGYWPLIQVVAELRGCLSLTNVQLCDRDHPPEGRCSPQGLLMQVRETAEHFNVPLALECVLPYDERGYDSLWQSAFGRIVRAGQAEQVTFFLLGDVLFDNWDAFCAFLKRMKSDSADHHQPLQLPPPPILPNDQWQWQHYQMQHGYSGYMSLQQKDNSESGSKSESESDADK